MTSQKEKDYKSKSNNNFNLNEKNSQQPEGLNHYKHCLPSFLLDEYFKQNSDCENDSSDEKENDKKNNSFDKTNEDKNISKNLLEEEKTAENSNHQINTKDELKNINIINKKNNIINNDINNININNNTSGNNSSKNIRKFPLFQEQNIFPNSFNNRNTSSYYYQNYLNSINNNINGINNINNMTNMHPLEPNYNILNNNINIINNNNFMDSNNNPYYLNNNINNNINNNNYPNQTFSFNQPMSKKYFNQSMKEINHINFSNNFPFSKLSYAHPSLHISNNEIYQEKHKKQNKKNKKEKQDENSIIKKMLNMSDYSLSNFLKNQKDSRDAQNALTNMKEKDVDLLINKLKNFISEVTIDKYGNYFTQKLIQICVPSQRLKLIQNLEGHFIDIANNSFGTHPLQSLMEIINMPEEKKLILKYILGNFYKNIFAIRKMKTDMN